MVFLVIKRGVILMTLNAAQMPNGSEETTKDLLYLIRNIGKP